MLAQSLDELRWLFLFQTVCLLRCLIQMAKQLTQEEVRKVAVLARLKLTDSEIESIGSQLSQMLEYVEILNEVDTTNIEPMAHVAELSNVLREDIVRKSLPRDKALANAPKSDGTYFLVPQILEGA